MYKLQVISSRVCMVLGSGGHTTEMVALARALDRRIYTPRSYIIADTDHLSRLKVEHEECGDADDVDLITIPRLPTDVMYLFNVNLMQIKRSRAVLHHQHTYYALRSSQKCSTHYTTATPATPSQWTRNVDHQLISLFTLTWTVKTNTLPAEPS